MNDDYNTPCLKCVAPGRWSVLTDDEGLDVFTVAAFACGNHVNRVLTDLTEDGSQFMLIPLFVLDGES